MKPKNDKGFDNKDFTFDVNLLKIIKISYSWNILDFSASSIYTSWNPCRIPIANLIRVYMSLLLNIKSFKFCSAGSYNLKYEIKIKINIY